MKVLHLAAGNRWTGAAAPAFAEVEALRAAGIDAHYAYVGGYKLEAKIGALPFTHAAIEKAQHPLSFMRSARRIRELIDGIGIEVVHAHLTHDHWVARLAIAGTKARLARTFHSRRVLRNDPLTRSLLGATSHLFAINDSFLPLHPGMVFTPPPLDHRQFSAEGPDARTLYSLPSDLKVVTAIGKLSKGRGWEAVLQTYAALRARVSGTRLMIIGHGEHRPALEALSRELGIAEHVLWAGYHEEDLAEHYRASDLLLFTERGSDEGHRAVLEAMACGVPVAAYPIEGVAALTGIDAIAEAPQPDALAALAGSMLGGDRDAQRHAVQERSQQFGYAPAARRLLDAYLTRSA